MEGQIRLRWTSHQGTVLSIFDALLSSESLVDVTLACEGQYIRAHKVILSACSPYFQELLSLDTNKHPIFFLKDVKYSELKALIHYMYRGEVNIAQDDLASLLVVAQALRIRGLAEVESANNSMSSDTIILPDIGNKSKVSTKVSSSVPTPVSVPSAATPSSSNLHLTRAFSQSHSFSSNINAVSTPIPSSSGVPSPSTAPPPPKKVRTETSARMSSGSQNVQKQSQKVDPLTVQMQPAIISTQTVPTQMFDPLQNTSTSGHYEPSGHGDDPNFGSEEIMVEQPEPMYTTDDVKLENEDQFITGAVEVDLEDEEENSMSQSSFTDNWKMSEGDNSGMADDDGEIPGGSGSNDGGVQGAEGGEVDSSEIIVIDSKKRYLCKKCGRSYSHMVSLHRHAKFECGVEIGRFQCQFCDFRAKLLHNLRSHELNCKSKLRFSMMLLKAPERM